MLGGLGRDDNEVAIAGAEQAPGYQSSHQGIEALQIAETPGGRFGRRGHSSTRSVSRIYAPAPKERPKYRLTPGLAMNQHRRLWADHRHNVNESSLVCMGREHVSTDVGFDGYFDGSELLIRQCERG